MKSGSVIGEIVGTERMGIGMADVCLLGKRKKILLKKTISGMLATTVLLSLPLSFAGCKKKSADKDRYRAGRTIKESDPYFNSETNKLQIPLDEGRDLEYLMFRKCFFNGEVAIAEYVGSYKIPNELIRQVEYTEDGGEILAYDPADYSFVETALFNAEGKLIKYLDGKVPIEAMTQGTDGKIYLLERADMSFVPGGIEGPSGDTKPEYRIEELDSSGNSIRIIPVDGGSEVTFYADIHVLDDGSFLLNDEENIYVFDRDGKITSKISDGERRLDGDLVLQDGKYYVMSRKSEFGTEGLIQFKEVDLTTGHLGSGINADALSAYEHVKPMRDGVFINTSSGCLRYDIVKGTIEEVFNWNDADVDRSLLISGMFKEPEIIPKDENEFSVIGYGSREMYGYAIPHLIQLTRAEKNPHAGKKILVIGGENVFEYPDLLAFASRYSGNTDSRSRIVFVDYTEGLRPGEGLISLEQSIYLDSLTGNGPDILVNMSDSIAFRNNSIMEDMNQYLDGEKGIDRSEYFDNIFRACETEGKLYHIPLKFELSGLGVNADQIPCSVGWTYDEFEEAFRNTPDQVSFLEATPCMDLLMLFLKSSLSQFVDYPNKKVDFVNEDMRRILSMAKAYGIEQIPNDEGYGYFEKDYGLHKSCISDENFDLTSVKVRNGKLLARHRTIRTVYDYSTFKGLSPANITFLGYPAKESTGMIVHPTLSMGILSSSTNKEQAWDFISAFMKEEPTNVTPFEAISIKRDTFEKESQTIMKSRNDYFEASYWDDPRQAEYVDYRVSEEDIDEVRKLIENVTISSSGDPELFAIIQEEAAGYFAGDRSIEDVLNVIQNRATTIVNEK